jgi:hypothetical protein
MPSNWPLLCLHITDSNSCWYGRLLAGMLRGSMHAPVGYATCLVSVYCKWEICFSVAFRFRCLLCSYFLPYVKIYELRLSLLRVSCTHSINRFYYSALDYSNNVRSSGGSSNFDIDFNNTLLNTQEPHSNIR